MKKVRRQSFSGVGPSAEVIELRARLAEAEETLRAIRNGKVDAVVVEGRYGPQVFTLIGAEHAYRVLVESMNEGALMLSPQETIIYANHCFARMVKTPLEQVMGRPFHRFLTAEHRAAFGRKAGPSHSLGAQTQVMLLAGDGTQVPAQISTRRIAQAGSKRAPVGMVVTDMTTARRNEELLRAFSQHLVQVQESERARVALSLHDDVAQLLCASMFSSQALMGKLSENQGPAIKEAMELRLLLRQTAEEVSHLSQDLRPSILDHLGLAELLRKAGEEFAARTGLTFTVSAGKLTMRLPSETELAIYRIFQEALKNVEQHARARQVNVSLKRKGAFVRLAIKDDGVGFSLVRPLVRRKGRYGLGLLSMRERATQMGADFKVISVPGAGTEIDLRIPLVATAGKGETRGQETG